MGIVPISRLRTSVTTVHRRRPSHASGASPLVRGVFASHATTESVGAGKGDDRELVISSLGLPRLVIDRRQRVCLLGILLISIHTILLFLHYYSYIRDGGLQPLFRRRQNDLRIHTTHDAASSVVASATEDGVMTSLFVPPTSLLLISIRYLL